MRKIRRKTSLIISVFLLVLLSANFVLADSAVDNLFNADLNNTPYAGIYDTTNPYLAAYDSIHNSDGTTVEGYYETYANNLLYQSNTSGYNGIATSTGGKVPGTEVSFYQGYENGKVIYSTNATITIPANSPVLARDGHGTETPISTARDYTTQVTGYVYAENGVIWVQFNVPDGENGGERPALYPYDQLKAEEKAMLPTPEPNDPNSKENPNNLGEGGSSLGHISMSQSTQVYSNFTPTPPTTEIRVYDDVYDINQGVPTSEYINVYGKAPKALYFIAVRSTTIRAWCDPVTIQATASYDNWEKVGSHKEATGRYNKSGDMIYKNVDDYGWVERGVGWKTCVDNYTDSVQKTYYDVTTSSIYSLVSVTVTETNETYSTYKLEKTIGMSGINGPGAQTLSFSLKRPNISATYQNDNEGNQGRNAEAAAIRAAQNSSGSGGKGAIYSALNAAVEGSVRGNVNYSWCGLRVTKTSCSGSPNPGFSEVNDEMLIPQTYPNGRYSPNGFFTYAGYGNVTDIPEAVYVHTPIVNTATITSTSSFVNQKVNIDSTKASANYYLMLDEEFTISIPDYGTHRNIAGYKSRTYNSRQGDTRQGNKTTTWAKVKDVKLPFDVYVNGKSGAKYFLSAGTWMTEATWWNSSAEDVTTRSTNVNLGTQYTFTIPVWVNEQIYTNTNGNPIYVRVIAENAYGDRNIDSVNHLNESGHYSINTGNNIGPSTNVYQYYAAWKTIDCEVIGKIYDLRINASNDPGWTQVYSQKTRNEYIMANEFPFGQAGQNRVTQYKYAPKLGYTFVFNFKTKGRKSNNVDVSIQPEGFYFVSKSGGAAQPVDLYYDSTTQKNIKILPGDTTGSVVVKLTDAFMEVPSQEFVDSNRIYQQEYGKIYNYNLGVTIGNFAKTNLPHSLRLCYNNFAEYVNALYGKGSTESSISSNAGTRDNVIGSVGHWWAGYRLPASTIAVKTGETPKADKSNALKNGYILVKFNIITKSPKTNTEDPVAGEAGNNYLRYLGPEALNEKLEETGKLDPNYTWPTPGKNTDPNPTHPGTLPSGTPTNYPNGSVAIFDADLKSSNDSEVAGTH